MSQATLYYYHALRITPPGKKSKSFRKVSHLKKFPKILTGIAHLAFEANRLFDAGLIVEHHTSLFQKPVRADLAAFIDDDQYLECGQD